MDIRKGSNSVGNYLGKAVLWNEAIQVTLKIQW